MARWDTLEADSSAGIEILPPRSRAQNEALAAVLTGFIQDGDELLARDDFLIRVTERILCDMVGGVASFSVTRR